MNTLMAKDTEYTLKGVKTFVGMDGYDLNATLCRKGKPVAFLVDEGSGGMIHWNWTDGHHDTKEEALFKAFIEEERTKIPADKVDEFGQNERKTFDGEMWVNTIVDEMENAKRLKRLCKTKTLFQVGAAIGGDDFLVIKGISPEIRAHIEKKYAGQKIRFMNDEFGAGK